MAQHAILRFEKHKGNPARPLEAHHERQKEQYASNPDIDTSRSKYNFLSFVMGFQRPCRVALVLLKPQNCVLCHSAPFPIPFLSGVFHRENPAEISSDRIGMDRI